MNGVHCTHIDGKVKKTRRSKYKNEHERPELRKE